ncbi:hypothetical protein [Saccharothrix sp. ST-888]|uniref:hypothetical protein n=1 Tax=Saccharothrix sp. ST-888 TaxID=1427391 RepID=UPI0005EC0621|nr:hypothetical protein [Saccharothrix sp. ST-888]KJK54925.1 hypothetical protein UK12_31910 [Saccharothrix sp. ST-888]
MIVIHPVLETGALPDFAFWPVAEQPPYHLTPLNGTLSDEQVGTAIATMVGYSSSRVDDRLTDPADAFLSSLLHEEGFVTPGGLRAQDTATGTTLTPGCCCGLEDWRGWLDIPDGGEPWLGHDPTPRAEQLGDTVRLHPDGEHPGPVIGIARTELPRLLARVQQDLADFLLLIAAWADQHAPQSAQTLVDAFDRSLEITAPLRKPN